jgi:hypothetical protein
MVSSFETHGFSEDCQFLYVDNSKSNVADAYLAYRMFLRAAEGEFVILCHQDVLLLDDGRPELDRALVALEEIDANWAICGNSGGSAPGVVCTRITDPHGANQKIGTFPKRVASLDENFIVVKASAHLSLSRDLSGFHFYGTDLCLVADLLGWTSYVIDFHLRHKSDGKADGSFAVVRRSLMDKYFRALRGRWIASPSAILFVGRSRLWSWLARSAMGVRLVYGVGRRLPPHIARRLFKSAT